MNQIFTHPGQPQMQVEVILASQGPDQKPIYTIRMRYPRIIHGEIMTHRVFSRNARSSRAVPVKTMLNEVRNIPFVPWHWGKNQKGMQASEECNEELLIDWDYSIDMEEWVTREEAWLNLRDLAAHTVEAYMEAGYHKQNPNRLLEPFSWIDTLITATEWDNFLWLRDHKDAEPHLQDLARLVKKAIENAEIQKLELDQWHQPYTDSYDWDESDQRGYIFDEANDFINKLSAARCARISYKPFNGDSSYVAELSRYNMLVTSDRVHASPTEHQATPDYPDIHGPLYGRARWQSPHLHGNLEGYIQARKLIPNEAYHG